MNFFSITAKLLGSSLSSGAQSCLSPATCSNSCGGILRHPQVSRRYSFSSVSWICLRASARLDMPETLFSREDDLTLNQERVFHHFLRTSDVKVLIFISAVSHLAANHSLMKPIGPRHLQKAEMWSWGHRTWTLHQLRTESEKNGSPDGVPLSLEINPTYCRQCEPNSICLYKDWIARSNKPSIPYSWSTPQGIPQGTRSKHMWTGWTNSQAPSRALVRVQSWSSVPQPGQNYYCSSWIYHRTLFFLLPIYLVIVWSHTEHTFCRSQYHPANSALMFGNVTLRQKTMIVFFSILNGTHFQWESVHHISPEEKSKVFSLLLQNVHLESKLQLHFFI